MTIAAIYLAGVALSLVLGGFITKGEAGGWIVFALVWPLALAIGAVMVFLVGAVAIGGMIREAFTPKSSG